MSQADVVQARSCLLCALPSVCCVCLQQRGPGSHSTIELPTRGSTPHLCCPLCLLQPRMLALCDWINWPSEVAATDLLLADGCRGARLLMQTLADALVSPWAMLGCAVCLKAATASCGHCLPPALECILHALVYVWLSPAPPCLPTPGCAGRCHLPQGNGIQHVSLCASALPAQPAARGSRHPRSAALAGCCCSPARAARLAGPRTAQHGEIAVLTYRSNSCRCMPCLAVSSTVHEAGSCIECIVGLGWLGPSQEVVLLTWS